MFVLQVTERNFDQWRRSVAADDYNRMHYDYRLRSKQQTPYLASCCMLTSHPNWTGVRTVTSGHLTIPCSYGQRSFAVNVPAVCNSLLPELQEHDISLDIFWRWLNMFRFSNWKTAFTAFRNKFLATKMTLLIGWLVGV